MTVRTEFRAEIDAQNKNVNAVKCTHCGSLILDKQNSIYVENEFDLPLIHQKNQVQLDQIETETITEFWAIENMFTFENIGFSNTVGIYKYLICADCEMGPVGYHDTNSKKSFIALQRVKHG